MRELKRAIPDMRAEYERVRAEGSLQDDYRVEDGEATLHKAGRADGASGPDAGKWEWLSYVQQGRRSGEFALRCPLTAQALEAVPGFMPASGSMPFSYAFFSVMHPGTAIDPHYGPTNARLRVHVPIHVPAGGKASLTVAGRELPWAEGEPVVFDDSFHHSARNDSEDETRVVMLFDVWHPHLAESEREGLCAMFDEARQKGWIS